MKQKLIPPKRKFKYSHKTTKKMKKLLSLAFLIVGFATMAQTQTFNTQVKFKQVPAGSTTTDKVATIGADGLLKQIPVTDIASPTPTLQAVTTAGNVSTNPVILNNWNSTEQNQLSSSSVSVSTNGGSTFGYLSPYFLRFANNGSTFELKKNENQIDSNVEIFAPRTSGTMALLTDIPTQTTPSLQQVTNNGNVTTNVIHADGGVRSNTYSLNDAGLIYNDGEQVAIESPNSVNILGGNAGLYVSNEGVGTTNDFKIAFLGENSFSVKKYDENASTSLNMAINDVDYDTNGGFYYNAEEGFNVQNSNLAGNLHTFFNINKNIVKLYASDSDNNKEAGIEIAPEGVVMRAPSESTIAKFTNADSDAYAEALTTDDGLVYFDVVDNEGYSTRITGGNIQFTAPNEEKVLTMGDINTSAVINLPSESGTLALKKYKSYVAILNGNLNDGYTATVLENDIDLSITFSRAAVGYFLLESPSQAFTDLKTVGFISSGQGVFAVNMFDGAPYSVEVVSWNLDGVQIDPQFNNASLEIRVYNP